MAATSPPPPGGAHKRARVAELSILGVCIFWGGSFTAVKDALDRSSAMVYTSLRFSLAALFLLLLYARRMRREHVAGGVLCGALLFLGYSFQTAGLRLTTASRSAFLTALSIPLTPFCQCLLFWRRPRVSDVAGATLACVGTFLLTRPSAPAAGAAGGQSASFNGGDAMTVVCALGFAMHIVALNHFSSEEAGPGAFQTVSVVQLAIVALFSAMLCDVAEHATLRSTPRYWAEVVVVALLATSVAFAVFAWAQKHTTATRTAIICSSGARPGRAQQYSRCLISAPLTLPASFASPRLLEAMFAAITSYFVYGEVMSGTNIGGAVLIVSGILAGELHSLPLPPFLRRAVPSAVDAGREDRQCGDEEGGVNGDEGTALMPVGRSSSG
jgi:drug/metabolite transporter (DMT)-like permease